jgi:ribosomal protein S18 acetylase RimI-like enzyme
MIIRKAQSNDYKEIAELILYAMEDIVYEFIGVRDYNEAKSFMQHFTSMENNQYSYRNCWIMEYEGSVVAVVNVYEGEKLLPLRMPVIHYLKEVYNRSYIPEDETQAGEWYVDSLAVIPENRGKGIASLLLGFLIEELAVKQGKILGLLVEPENTGARKLYAKLGFQPVGMKTLAGKSMNHLQYRPNFK